MALSPVTTEHPSAPATPPATGWGLFRGATVVAVVLLLVGALAWFVFGIGTGNFVDSDAKRVLERQKILADRNTEDTKLLHDPASWLAKDKGIVRVPIDRAVEMTIPDLQKVQPHPAYPLTQSPPQPANAPTSPDKGAGATTAAVAPSASNPTVGQPSPAPVTAATPAPATSASNAPAAPANPPAAPAASAPAPSAVPAATPMGVPAPSPDNNANNPGNPPVPGTSAQPAAPAPAPTAAPATGAKPEPLTPPPAPTGTATPAASEATTPTPSVTTPGASPAGTP